MFGTRVIKNGREITCEKKIANRPQRKGASRQRVSCRLSDHG